MTCEAWRDLILLEAEGTLGADESRRLAEHLAACAACREYSAEARARLGTLAAEPLPEVPPALEARLMEMIQTSGVCQTSEVSTGRRTLRRAFRRYWPAAAALVIGLALAVAVLSRPGPERKEPDLAGLSNQRIAADIAAVERAIAEHRRPLEAASTAPETASAPADDVPSARPAFDEDLHRIGHEIEALGRPIFADSTGEKGGNG